MNTFKTLLLLSLVSVLALPLQAQSKKELRQQIAQLQTELANRNSELAQLEGTNERLLEENQNFVQQNVQMRQQMTQLQRDYDDLNRRYQQLLNQGGAPPVSGGTTTPPPMGNTNPPSTATPTMPPAPSGTVSKCEYYGPRLAANTSYRSDYTPHAGGGFGIQVFSSADMCQAASIAESFSRDYRLYPTFIRVKSVNGKRVFAVVYGALPTDEQARTYLGNFKRVAPARWSANAFVVSH